MKKFVQTIGTYEDSHVNPGIYKKMFLIMRLTMILMFFATIQVSATGYAQITVSAKNESMQKVFREIQKQSGYDFLYSYELLERAGNISVDIKNAPIKEAVNECIKGKNLTFTIVDNTVVVKAKSETDQQQIKYSLKGKVRDEAGNPVCGAAILIKGTSAGVVTNEDGTYMITLPSRKETLIISFIGMKTKEISFNGQETINIILEEEAFETEAVVFTGIITRKAESFTGSAITVNKEDLLRAGNQNIFQSLKNIDPAFVVVENNVSGSNPNTMPEIVLRGRTNMPDLTGTYSGNPNQPLFILDGFETTIQTIYDLDMNRIQNVTILKDAAAKAMYGSKAGNGVVVVETVQPTKGRLKVNYTGNLNIEAPDLTGYNLMDSKEKLQWEKDHEMWTTYYSGSTNILREQMYNQYYQDVYLKGVNTYWLSQPLRTGVGQKHSIFFEGGDDYMRYGADFSYNNITGVMKDSKRNTFTGSTTLSYRYKNLTFRNQIQFAQNTANNSPYGSFSTYVAMNPYWSPYDDNGKLKKIAGFYPDGYNESAWALSYNPLYNASLNSIDQSKYTQIRDNFYIEWRIHDKLRITGSFGYTHQRDVSDNFLPPSHTNFINYTEENGLINYRGKWTHENGSSSSMESKLGIDYTYSKNKNLLLLNISSNLSENKSNNIRTVAEGFGSDNSSDISMGTYYQRSGSPLGSDNHIREVGVVGIASYSYDNRFLFDATYRTSASSIYGKNSRWGSFWSFGTGWNLHNEQFIKNLNFIQQLRLRGSLGYTGSQNVDSYLTLATYKYGSVVYDGIKEGILMGLPNPDLEWQRNMDYNVGLDLTVRNLSVRFETYKKITTNLLASITAPPSIGFSTYRDNLGKTINSGSELYLRYQVFNNVKKRAYLNISASAAHNKNVLSEIADAFKSYNDKQDESVTQTNKLYSGPVVRYYEGQSLTAIWAMPSLGIDPYTGNEFFLDKDGNITQTWSSTDLVIAGDSEPTISGTFAVNAGYKGFTLGITCSYKYGGQLYNSTLVERVENIDGRSNLDRRVMDAWHKTGDLAIYRKPQVSSAINYLNYTKPTTRFIQDNNEFYFSTVNLGYDVQDLNFLEKIGMERLRVTFYTNELLRLSSIKTERGTSYPFARNFSFSLQATF